MAIDTSPRPVGALRIEVPATADRLGDVRRRLAAWLAPIGVDESMVADIVLVVNEAVTNSIEHAYRDGDGIIRVDADVDGGRVTVRVTDFGSWRPAPTQPNNRGRGLPIMHAVSEHVELDSSPQGTTVRVEFELSEGSRGPSR